MIKILNDGGIFMWVILILSIHGLAVVVEKIYLFCKIEKKKSKNYISLLQEKIEMGTEKEILELCKNQKNSISKIMIKSINQIEKGFDNIIYSDKKYIKKIVELNMLEQITKLEKRMWLLKSVVNSAPQLGLLGTVTGMIVSFAALGGEGVENAKIVANGISEALYTTAFGLIVAIPLLIFYNYFEKRIDNIIFEMETLSLSFEKRVEKMKDKD